MGLNKAKGNMYKDWVTHTWNTVKGRCEHDCAYCYMKRFGELNPVRFDEKELKTNLGKGNFIFVGSSCDMWAEGIPIEWIEKTIIHCNQYENKYLFQSKNPKRFIEFIKDMEVPLKRICVLGTTIESNRNYPEITPDNIEGRAAAIKELEFKCYRTMITIEPVLDFDVKPFLDLIRGANPDWVNIGADSKRHGLPEPSKSKILDLIEGLKEFTEVRQKTNLGRLLK